MSETDFLASLSETREAAKALHRLTPTAGGSLLARAAASAKPKPFRRITDAPTDPKSVSPFQRRAEDLLAEADQLEKRVWHAAKAIKRSPFPLPILPTDLAAEAKAWNAQVLELADQILSVKESAQADVFPTMLGNMLSAEAVAALIASNSDTLRRIITVEKAKR